MKKLLPKRFVYDVLLNYIFQAILKKAPGTLSQCAEWMQVLAIVQNATEEIKDRFQQILDFHNLMEQFSINKNQRTTDAATIKGITDSFNSLLETAESAKDQKQTHVRYIP